MNELPRIDAHHHFWRLADRVGQWPPPALASIHRNFEPADLLPALEHCGVSGTVLVQTLPSMAETDALLEIASSHAFVFGVVGWVDMTRADAAHHIARLAAHPKLKGLRPMLQDLTDDGWSNDPAFDAAGRAMVEHGLAFDALVLAHQLPPLLAFARRHPQLPIVIDHGAKPPIARGVIQPWGRDMKALAELPNVHCKLSGLLTEAGERTDSAALAPYVERMVADFGWQRLMWGSDWPVLRLAADYEAWFAMARSLCLAQPGADAAAMAAVFGANARRFYRLALHPD
jgi:L-fuconolactonase